MTLSDLDHIEQLRLKASKGPWEAWQPAGVNWHIQAADGYGVFVLVRDKQNALYLAALSPDVVGELLRLARERLEQTTLEPCGCEIYQTCEKCRTTPKQKGGQ